MFLWKARFRLKTDAVIDTKKETGSNPHSNAVDISEKPDNVTGKTRYGVRQRIADPFLCISMKHWRTAKMTANELRVFLVMADRADRQNRVHASQQHIAEELKISQSSVSGYVCSLVNKGYLLRRQRKGFATVEFHISPRAAWSDKLVYRNSQLERLQRDELKALMKRIRAQTEEAA